MPEAIVPFFVLGGFLALVVMLLLLAVRRARRGFSWSDGDGGFTADDDSGRRRSDGEERQ